MGELVFILNNLWLVLALFFAYWWLWVPVMLFLAYIGALKKYNQKVYLSGLKWVMLELKVPIDAHKSPKAMEQVFAALHSIGGIGDPPENLWAKFKAWRESVFKGKVPDWYVFEIFATGGEIQLFIRCQEQHRVIVESQFFAHYPEAEITPVPDYIAHLPPAAPDVQFDMTGAELGLTKEDIFPIRTYPEFEETGGGKDDIRRVDPLAPLAEAMNALLLGEYAAVQFMVRSTSDKWVKAWAKKNQDALNKAMGREEKKTPKAAEKIFATIESGLGAGVEALGGGAAEKKEEEKKKEEKPFNQLNPGIQDMIKTTEKALAKLQFQVGIRVVYIARRDRFLKERLSSLTATFRVFSTQALNGFKNAFTPEVKKGFNKEARTIENKHKLYGRFLEREFPEKPFVLNTEELTTVFHVPDVSVRTPALPRVEAKKGEAPAGLPTV